jgi:hypothetical protein
MSDYLSRLAERTLGLVETVQPLTPPMFATAASTPVESLHLDQTPPRPEARTEIVRLTEAAPGSLMPQEKRTPPDPRERLSATRSDDEATPLRPRPAAHESAAHLRRVETAPERAPAQETPPLTSRTGEPPPTRTHAQTGEPALVAVPSGNSRPANETTPPARQHNSADAAAANRDARPGSAEQTTHSTPRPETLIKTIPQTRARDDMGLQRSRQRSANDINESPAMTQEAHPVRVQIGRIEVRAVNAPAPTQTPRKSSAPAPRLSLEEYLRSRNGGRR